MDFKKILKVFAVVAAIVALAAAAYVAIQKLTAKKEPEYFDDNEFFECDNELEIVEVTEDEAEVEPQAESEEAPAKKTKKSAKK